MLTPEQKQRALDYEGPSYADFVDEEDMIVCLKCGAISGDSWGQCNKSCPMPMSPWFNEVENDNT